jgi:hypothetical protein
VPERLKEWKQAKIKGRKRNEQGTKGSNKEGWKEIKRERTKK